MSNPNGSLSSSSAVHDEVVARRRGSVGGAKMRLPPDARTDLAAQWPRLLSADNSTMDDARDRTMIASITFNDEYFARTKQYYSL